MKIHSGYDHIRDIPADAWKKKEWPIGMPDPELPLKEKTTLRIFPSKEDAEEFAEKNILPEEHEPEPKQRKIRFPEEG